MLSLFLCFKEKKMKNISVVIPFKGQVATQKLVGCVFSLINQTVLPLEIILVGPQNNLSLNSTTKKYQVNKMIKLVYFDGDKNGARNEGIRYAKGDFILYLDHDMKADKKLVEDCLKLSQKFDAVIIPEKGAGGNFWENCRKLEKELIAYDIHTVTPRFYKRSFFKDREKPFDSRFGLLDEWGFNQKLAKKNACLGYSNSFVVVKEDNLTLLKEIRNKFKRGLWMRNFYRIDKKEALVRINPIQRGLIFYGKRIHYFFKEPIYFPGLIILKIIDFLSFMSGYLVSFFYKSK